MEKEKRINIGNGYIIEKWNEKKYMIYRDKSINSELFYYDYEKNISIFDSMVFNNKTTQKLIKRYFKNKIKENKKMENKRILTELGKDIILSYCRVFERILESGNHVYWSDGRNFFQHDIDHIRERIENNTYNGDYLVKNFVYDMIPRFTWDALTIESD